MKKVIPDSTSEIQTIERKRVHSHSIVGIQQGNHRGFIVRTDYLRGDYRILSATDTHLGNGWCTTFSSFNVMMDFLTKSSPGKLEFQVFVFDTNKELFTWLAEID